MNHNHKTPRVHKHTLIEMNIAVFTARREAAHARVMEILRMEIRAGDKEKRINGYAQCHVLTQEAILATRRSQLQPQSPMLSYFQLLHDAIGVSLALARHELNLNREKDELRSSSEHSAAAALPQFKPEFSDAEKNQLDCLLGLLTFGEPLVQRDSAQRLQHFSTDDRRRYELARSEYQTYYRNFPSQEEPEKPPADGAEPQDTPC